METQFDVLVLGAGINGLATAYHLSLQKGLRVGIIEQFAIGHSHGGSHGSSRIIRSTYDHPAYIRLVQRARQEWDELEKKEESPLIHSNPGCFFGGGKNFEKYVTSIANCGLAIEVLDPIKARRIFPQFHFPNTSAVLLDHTGGVIAAKKTIDTLVSLITKNGVDVCENTKVLKIDPNEDSIKLFSDQGEFLTDRLVITTGAWMKQLIPIRQTVAYFKLQGPQELYQIGRFPNWSFIGAEENQAFYGLPEFGCTGIKVSQHVTTGRQDDPDEAGDPRQLEVLEEFVRRHFVQSIDKLVGSETCFYANTPDENFILDLLPSDNRIAIGSACSGHGFKFAPLTGRILAELVLNRKTTIAEFEESRELFRWNRYKCDAESRFF